MQTKHLQLATWLNVPFDQLRKSLSLHGVNSRGWRLYLDIGDALFEPLSKRFTACNDHTKIKELTLAWLRLVQACEMDVPPPLALSESMVNWRLPSEGIAAIPPLFLRAAWKAALQAEYSKKSVPALVRDEITPLAQWFFSSGAYREITESQLKAGWQSLAQKYEIAMLNERANQHEWPPFLTKVECSGYRFMALASQAALEIEGREMSHCIASYGEHCREQMLRVWSVLEIKTGKRIATMTVEEDAPGVWRVDEIYGPANQLPSDRIVRAASAVALSMDDAYRRDSATRQEIDMHRFQLEITRRRAKAMRTMDQTAIELIH